MTFNKFTVAIALAIAAVTAQAETFNYSYTFSDGTQVTGSFDGTSDGTLVTGLTKIFANINGTPFNGSGNLAGFNYDGTSSGGAVAAFDGRKNDFAFIDSPVADWSKNYFVSGPLGGPPPVPDYEVYAGGLYTYDYEYGHMRTPYTFSDAQWSLTSVSAVPEPETYAMLLAGLGLMGAVARRRRAKQA
jgi:hypothetical protein